MWLWETYVFQGDKLERPKEQEKWRGHGKKSCSLVSEFLWTSYCAGSSAAHWSSTPERRAEWVETLTGVEQFSWPLRSFFGSVAQLKDPLGWSNEEGAAAGKTSPKYPFVPQSLNAERAAWMSLLRATVHHGKMPTRAMDWANNNTTPLTLCLPDHLRRLAFYSFFILIGFLQKKKKARNFLLVSQVLVSCFCAGYSTVIQAPSPVLALDARVAVAAALSPSQPLTSYLAYRTCSPLSEKRDFPSPGHVYDCTLVLSEQFMHYF